MSERKPTEAAAELVRRLGLNTGYYRWTPVNLEHTVLMRVPRKDIPDAEWLLSEEPAILHICSAREYLNAIEAADGDASVKYVGYVIDGKCTQCEYRVS